MAKADTEENLNVKEYKKLREENIKLKEIIVRIKGCLETTNLKQ